MRRDGAGPPRQNADDHVHLFRRQDLSDSRDHGHATCPDNSVFGRFRLISDHVDTERGAGQNDPRSDPQSEQHISPDLMIAIVGS